MSLLGHLRRFERTRPTSEVPPKADIRLRCNICRNGPCVDDSELARVFFTNPGGQRGQASHYPTAAPFLRFLRLANKSITPSPPAKSGYVVILSAEASLERAAVLFRA